MACGDERRLTGNGSTLEVVLHDDALYKSTYFTFTLLYMLMYRVEFRPEDYIADEVEDVTAVKEEES